jgi:hypothetical protein
MANSKSIPFICITSTLINTVLVGKIYQVFNDKKQDERYIYDENGEKILFDKTIFNYKLL